MEKGHIMLRPKIDIAKNFYAAVAQSVEQGTENPCVGGSIPPRCTL